MMKTILKGLLLWTTAFAVIITILSTESLIEQHNIVTLFVFIAISLVLIISCASLISWDEIEKLSGTHYIDTHILKSHENE